jgi:hypothetical protein
LTAGFVFSLLTIPFLGDAPCKSRKTLLKAARRHSCS